MRTAVALFAICLAPVAGGVEATGGQSGGTMTREQAVDLLESLYRSIGKDNAILKPDHILYASKSGTALIAFNYDAEKKALTCRAEIYLFHREPLPGLIEGFRDEEKTGTATGGGELEYVASNRGLYLRRVYTKPVDREIFATEMRELGEAGLRWGRDVFDRVNARVRARKGASSK